MRIYIVIVTIMIVLCFAQVQSARGDHRVPSSELTSPFPLNSKPPSIIVDLDCGFNPGWPPELVPFRLALTSLDNHLLRQAGAQGHAVGDQLRTADVGGWITIAIAAYAVLFLLRPKKTDSSPQSHKPPVAPGGGDAAQERQ